MGYGKVDGGIQAAKIVHLIKLVLMKFFTCNLSLTLSTAHYVRLIRLTELAHSDSFSETIDRAMEAHQQCERSNIRLPKQLEHIPADGKKISIVINLNPETINRLEEEMARTRKSLSLIVTSALVTFDQIMGSNESAQNPASFHLYSLPSLISLRNQPGF